MTVGSPATKPLRRPGAAERLESVCNTIHGYALLRTGYRLARDLCGTQAESSFQPFEVSRAQLLAAAELRIDTPCATCLERSQQLARNRQALLAKMQHGCSDPRDRLRVADQG